MSDWKPDLYMQFKSERTQPSIDLVSKLNIIDPKNIIDIGCGPGNSTQILANRWPNSNIIGIDRSESMIEKAKHDFPNQKWELANASEYTSSRKFDIIFSNAVIQWIPNHEKLFKKFYNMLSQSGVVAIQIPQFWDMSLGKIIDDASKLPRWEEKISEISNLLTMQSYSFYYDILSNLFNSIEIWETDYIHIMEGHLSILNMIRSTGLKPYNDKLELDSDIKEFEAVVLSQIKRAYPIQKNGKVLLPFKRLFITAVK